MDLIIRGGRAHPTGDRHPDPVDVGIEAGRIVRVAPAGTLAADGARELDAGGRFVSPPLVDPHVHLDAVLTVGEPRYNES